MKTINKDGASSRQRKIENALVSHVESVADLLVVWCYDPLKEEFIAVLETLETLKEQLERGDLRIKDVRDAEQDKVYLYRVDDLCDSDSLRAEAQAVKYVLDRVKPKESHCWSESVVRFCQEKLLDKSVTLKVEGSVGEDLDLVSICSPRSEGASFNEFLVSEDMASRCSSRADELSFWSLAPCGSSRGTQACYLVHRPAPHRLFLQTKRHRDEFGFPRMEEELNEENGEPYNAVINHGQPILAYNDEKFRNCRGLVSKMKNRDYLVYFVDYGNSELKSRDEIYVLPRKYLRAPVLAHECVLDEECELAEIDEGTEINCSFISDTKPYKIILRESETGSPSYDAVKLNVGGEYEVSVNFVKNVLDFYVRLKRFTKEYDLLQARLQLSIDDQKSSSLENDEVKTCAVFCTVEQKWVRGLIAFRSTFIAPVTHVDSGRTDDMCTPDALRPISQELVRSLPAQAIKCRLHFSSPPASFPAEQAKQAFLQNIAKCSEHLKAKVVKIEGEYAEVILIDSLDDTFSINDKILFQIGTNVARAISSPLLRKVENVYVTVFNSFRDFYCQLTKISMDELYELEVRLNQYGNSMSPPSLFSSKVEADWSAEGRVCCAKYSGDGRFYRGRVVEHSPLEARVLFVDYGNTEIFEHHEVKVLSAELAATPQVGFACGATETLKFETEAGQVRTALLNQTLEVEILGEKEPGFFEISFTQAPCNEAVLRLLQPTALVPTVSSAGSIRAHDAEQQLINLPFERNESAMLIHLRNFRQIFFQLPKYHADLTHVQVNTQLAAKHGEKFEGVITRNTVCLAKFPFDETWYRAKILDLCPGEKYLVVFVDFGNRDVVHHSDIRRMPNHLVEYPKLALECCLYKHPDFEIPEAVLEEFENEALEMIFKVEFIESEDNTPRVFVNFTDRSGIDLIDKYITKAAAMNSQGGRSGTNPRGGYNNEGRSSFYGGRNEDQPSQGGGRGSYESNVWSPDNNAETGGGYRSQPQRSGNNFNSRDRGTTGWSNGGGGNQRRMQDVPPRFQNQTRDESAGGKSNFRDESAEKGRPFYQKTEQSWGNSEAKNGEQENRTPNTFSSNRGRNESPKDNSSWNKEESNTRSFSRDERSGGQRWNNQEDNRNNREDRSGGGGRNEGSKWNSSEDNRNTREDRSGGGRNERWNSSEDNRNGENRSRNFNGGGGRDRSGFNEDRGGGSRNEDRKPWQKDDNQKPPWQKNEDRKPWQKDEERKPWQKDENQKPPWQKNEDRKPWQKDENQKSSWGNDRNAGSNNFRNDNNKSWNRDSKTETNASWNSTTKATVVEVSWDSGAPAVAKESSGVQVSEVKIQVGDFKEISVMYAVTPEEFYCHLVDFKTQSSYREMNEKLNKTCGEGKKLENCSVGAICAACFSEDQVWYRAKIVAIDGTNATISFIDYGNGDSCSLDSLKTLEPELAKLPARAIKCSLFDVKPEGKEWNDDQADYFESVVTKAHYLARFLAENEAKDGFVVDMVDSFLFNDLSLRYQLMKERDIVPRSTSDEVYAQLAASVWKDQSAFSRSALEVGAKFTGYVSWVNFPGEFYARDLKAEAEWSAFDAKLNAAYAALTANELVLKELEKGKPCVTPFTCDGVKAWYRALILAVEEEHAIVSYVDFGNVERVEFHEIKTLKQEFTELPAQALLLSVANLKPLGSHWKSISQADLGKYLTGDLECEVKEVGNGWYTVDASLGETNVATRMIEDGLAYFEEGHCCPVSEATRAVVEKILLSSQVKIVESAPASTEAASPAITPSGDTSSLSSPSPEISIPADINEERVEAVKEEQKEPSVVESSSIGNAGIELGSRFECSVSFVNGLDSFYLQRSGDYERLDALSAFLNSAFADSEPEETMSWQVGQMCVARYEEDQAWYRAHILEQQDFGFRLLFVDYGNVEFVTFDQIRTLPESWSAVPYLALRCRLHGLGEVQEEKRKPVNDALNEILNGSESFEVAVKRIEENKDAEKLFWLEVSTAGTDVAKELKEKFEIVAEEKNEGEKEKTLLKEEKAESAEVKLESEQKEPETAEKKPEIEEKKPEIEDKKPEIEDKEPEIEDKKPEIEEKKPEIVEKKLKSVKVVNAKATKCVLGEKVEVCVSFVETPDRFWLQKVSDSTRLTVLLEELALFFEENGEKEQAGELLAGDLRAVKFSEDDGWYRGEVESLSEEGAAEVRFVDFGNSEAFEKNSARVQPLGKDEWRQAEYFAVQCELLREEDKVWSEEAKEAFKNNYENKTCLVEFLERKSEDGVYKVRLLDMGLDVAKVISGQKEPEGGEKNESFGADQSSAEAANDESSKNVSESSSSEESSKNVSSSSASEESSKSSSEDSANESSVLASAVEKESSEVADEFNKSLVVPSYDEFAENASAHPRSESPSAVVQKEAEAVQELSQRGESEPEAAKDVPASENEAAESFIAERLNDLDSKKSSIEEKNEEVGGEEKSKSLDESDDSSTLENTSAELEVNSAELLKDEESVPTQE